ncbi:Protein transport protein Sec24B [Dirofilaria immitis]|nr:Protein transport protein Sec24B [Dirofilaria immitis]
MEIVEDDYGACDSRDTSLCFIDLTDRNFDNTNLLDVLACEISRWGTNNQIMWQQHPQPNTSVTAHSNQSFFGSDLMKWFLCYSIQSISWTTKIQSSNNPVANQGYPYDNMLSCLQQNPNAFPSNDNIRPLFHDSSVSSSTCNYITSCSVTHHQINNIWINSTGHNDITFQPHLFPSFSTTPFSSSVLSVNASVPASAVLPETSSFSYLPDQDTNRDSVVTSAQYLPPAFTQPVISVAYRSNARNEIGLHHSFPFSDKHSQSRPLNDHHQMNGNYSGGMGSLQQEFARMTHGMQSTRYVDLIQERDLMKYGIDDEEIALPPTQANVRLSGVIITFIKSVPISSCLTSRFLIILQYISLHIELSTSDPRTVEKSRLPFGLTLQPFRDMKNLNIIQTSSIVRCRYCRTYINPYIYLPDSRHWKCNICYRVNDLPDDFNWDPAKKSLGEPTHRPEIKNATLRPPQPAVYVFVMDISQNAIETGYLYTFTEQLLITLEQLPGDERTMLGFIGVDTAVHFFNSEENHIRSSSYNHFLIRKQRIHKHIASVAKTELLQIIMFLNLLRCQNIYIFADIFLPVNCGLLVNLRKNVDAIRLFIQSLPALYESNSSTSCCLGAALTAAHELIADVGGRITVLLTMIPDLGPGTLKSREDPNQRAASEVPNLCPANDYYKRLALECTGHQIAVDLFLMNSQYSDLSTLGKFYADMSKFSTGCVFHFPNYHINHDQVQVKRFQKQLNRYLVRKIGFEAVLRIRCTKDLLAMANINPDSAIAVQVQMEENLIGINTVCFQAAVLYTSSRGDRRIRIHTLCLPVTKDLTTVFSQFDVKCAISLLSKMAVERTLMGASLTDSREAMVNTVIDVFGAYNSAVSRMSHTSSMLSPITSMRLLPLYILGMLKHRAFVAGQSIRLDNRVAALLLFRSAPLEVIDLELYPALYELNHFVEHETHPPRLHLSFEHINRDGVYLLDTGSYVYIYISSNVEASVIKRLFDVNTFEKIDDEASLFSSSPFEALDNPFSNRVHSFLRKLSVCRTVFAPVILIREDSPLRSLFSGRLIDDRTESSHSYIEFLSYIRQEIRKYTGVITSSKYLSPMVRRVFFISASLVRLIRLRRSRSTIIRISGNSVIVASIFMIFISNLRKITIHLVRALTYWYILHHTERAVIDFKE